MNQLNDPVNHPSHYTQGKIECIDFITDKKMNFCRGNAVKYIVRAGLKDPDKEIEDLEKAIFYLNREIKMLEDSKREHERCENCVYSALRCHFDENNEYIQTFGPECKKTCGSVDLNGWCESYKKDPKWIHQ